MISSPTDYPPLDVEREWEKLKDAASDLEAQGLLELERLSSASLAALQRQLRRGEYHIFHFVGHGTFDEQSQDGVLLLESESGRGRSVSGRDLGTILYDHRSLRLALLNACEGARTSRSDPFAGVAHSLVQKRIPAVIAMQFEITDDAAITLAHAFYAALVDGYPVDAALAEARKAIFAQENDVEWGTPVLYLSAIDGRVFAVDRISEEELRQRQIETLLLAAQAAAATHDWDTAAEKYQAVLALEPGHTAATSGLGEIRQQRELSVLYDRGLKHYQAGRWQQATHYLQQVQRYDPAYRDVSTLLFTATREMARSLAEPAAPDQPQSRRWLWLAIPAFILLLVIAGLGSYIVFGPGGTPTDEAPIVVNPPTSTPTVTPGSSQARAVAGASSEDDTATPTPTATPSPTVGVVSTGPKPGIGPLSFCLPGEFNEPARRCTVARTTFNRPVTTIYVSWTWENVEPGMVFRREWIRNGVVEKETTTSLQAANWDFDDGASEYTFLQFNPGLGAGNWTVRFSLDGDLVQTGTFTIQ